jgi:tetratricopeptide (TPR) repeat protein
MKRLLLDESRIRPFLLIVEDLHWIDAETQALLDGLVESLPATRLLLLVTYRPEHRQAWSHKSYYTQIRIDPLPAENARALLGSLLGEDETLAPLKQLLIERTEGNPFFLEESVRTLVESQALVGERGAYRLAQALPSIQVPATVQAVLAARIDRLSADDKQLLQSAAVVGKDVPFSLLTAIADEPEEVVRERLSRLQAAELLYELRMPPDLEFTFTHALTHEVAYGTLLPEQRRTLHAKIVEAIEGLYPDRLIEQVERLAHHAVGGEMWEKALAYLREAGTKAAARSAHREAVAHFERALAVLPHLAESVVSREAAIDLRFACRTSLLPLGALDRILELLREAELLAGGLEDLRRLGWVTTYMTIHFSMTAQNDQALTLGQRAVTIAETVADVRLTAVARGYLGQAEYRAGDYRRAADTLRSSVASLTGDLMRERLGQAVLPAVYARTLLAASLAELGEFSEATALADESIKIAETLDHPFSLGLAFDGAGRLLLGRGDVPAAIGVLEHVRDVCRARFVEYWLPIIYASLGLAYAAGGRLTEAFPLLEEARERLSAPQNVIYQSLLLTSLSESSLLAGRPAEAAQHAEEALRVAIHRGERGIQAHALRLLGAIGESREARDVGQAEQRYREALALADALGMRPLVAHCHFGLGTLGERKHLATATTMYRDMGMAFWLQKAESVSRR